MEESALPSSGLSGLLGGVVCSQYLNQYSTLTGYRTGLGRRWGDLNEVGQTLPRMVERVGYPGLSGL